MLAPTYVTASPAIEIDSLTHVGCNQFDFFDSVVMWMLRLARGSGNNRHVYSSRWQRLVEEEKSGQILTQ